MSRVAGSYESVVRGVSEQVPQDRRPGQHYEQVNLISDPVRGLARRHGSKLMDEVSMRGYSAAALTNVLADTLNHKVFPFQSNGKDYDLIYRTAASVGQAGEDTVFCFDKAAQQFVPVVMSPGPFMASLAAGGISAVANVGDFLLLAGHNLRATTVETDEVNATRDAFAAWVRGGAYARNYTIKLGMADGTQRVFTYKTPTTAYPGTLDTSDIAATDTEYTKKVNDRVNAYNTAATQWIGTSATAIVPANIAQSLLDLLVADGFIANRVDSTIMITNNTGSYEVLSITCEDSGDGTLFRGVGNEVAAAELVSTIHRIGKVVRVRPKRNDGSDVFYLKAYRQGTGTATFAEVTWREAAGYTVLPQNLWGYAKVHTDGVMYIGGNSTEFQTLGTGAAPVPVSNGVGDRVSSPVPHFFGKRVDYLGVFQDRLVVGSGAVLYFSRTGDYQNFWRQSVLTVDAADPIEMFALGAESDTIRASTTYDRNLLLFGERHQYVVSGRVPLTPSNASIVVQSSHEDAVDANPVNSGNFVFYAKYRNGVGSLHQVQIGQLADSPESYELSKQLDRYITGKPTEILAMTSPNMVFVRTTGNRQRVYVYAYLDSPGGGERLFDSWHKWEWSPWMGSIIGISKHDGDMFMYVVRRGRAAATATQSLFVGAERFVLDSTVSDTPYLDSQRTLDDVYGAVSPNTPATDLYVAYKKQSQRYMLGTTYEKRAQLEQAYPGTAADRVVGFGYSAYVTPTNPYILDSKGKAVIIGRLTVTGFSVSVADTGGMQAEVTTVNGTSRVTDYSGRSIGQVSNSVGIAPIVTGAVSVLAGRESREFTYKLSALDWLPLTITAIEWRGQFFSNIRRV